MRIEIKTFLLVLKLSKKSVLTDFKATAVAAETNSAKFGVDASFDMIENRFSYFSFHARLKSMLGIMLLLELHLFLMFFSVNNF